ncbi:hypothetical protein [Streptacidiphilus sp. EB129]|uniref:BACON domain-containing protein n=1 Tax=Streptacidiphilus sp. EB129 TaxID=3156262 RepID=UPI0035153D5D
MTTDAQIRPQHGAHAARTGPTVRGGGPRSLDDCWELLGDALFTYCLSALCDQEEAVAAVREVRQLSIRHRRRLRRPEQARAWLYALARYTCLLRTEAAPTGADRHGVTGRHSSQQSRLAALSWPEAAGIPPLQREVLELAGRHGLDGVELAAVLGLRADQAGVLTAQAVCELERTAAVLTVLGAEDCPELARLAARRGPVLGAALRGELVRHVDDCPTCRGTAERAAAAGPWPGTLRTPETLGLVQAPPETWSATGGDGFFAVLGGGRCRRGPSGATGAPEARRTGAARSSAPGPRTGAVAQEIRFDRRGFPVHRTPRSERAALLRQRTMTGSVIALVVAAPVVALWVAHQGPGQSPEESPVSSVQVDSTPTGGTPPDAARPGDPLPPGPPHGTGGHHGAALGPLLTGPSSSGTGGVTPLVALSDPAPGLLTVTAGELNGRTVVTLANPGRTAVAWQAATSADWLRLSRSSGTVQPGGQFTLLVTVDEARLPDAAWTEQLTVEPSGSVVVLQGPGTGGRRGLPPPVGAPSTPPPSSAPPVTGSPSGGPTPAPSGSVTSPGSGSGSGAGSGAGSHPPSPSASPSATATPSATASATGAGSPSGAAPSGRHRAPSVVTG